MGLDNHPKHRGPQVLMNSQYLELLGPVLHAEAIGQRDWKRESTSTAFLKVGRHRRRLKAKYDNRDCTSTEEERCNFLSIIDAMRGFPFLSTFCGTAAVRLAKHFARRT